MLVLGIDVDDQMLDRWRAWLMPAEQPVVVPAAVAANLGFEDERDRLSFELMDTFELYSVPDDDAVVWLTRAQFRALPAEVRHRQPAPHRWPRRSDTDERAQAVRFIELGRRPSTHRAVTAAQWARAANALPDARTLGGTYPDRSGPNCFGTVMGAAGVAGAADEWIQLRPFEEWLADSTSPGGNDDVPGTVLVWRDAYGLPAHAAVTLGGGWLLHKPSQGWMSPTKVLTVRDGISSARQRGRHLVRYRLS